MGPFAELFERKPRLVFPPTCIAATFAYTIVAKVLRNRATDKEKSTVQIKESITNCGHTTESLNHSPQRLPVISTMTCRLKGVPLYEPLTVQRL